MNCPSCHHENRTGHRFCIECGTPLVMICPRCQAQNEPNAKFCGDCGTALMEFQKAENSRASTPKHLADKILQSKATLEGERKHVTVFFADLKSSMDLAEQLDPEEWHRIMDRFFVILAEGIQRFEGTINQYGGDGIMALFGAPIAHEDHAHRACYAALHLKEALRHFAADLKRSRGFDFAVRIGLNSGEIVVGSIGDDFRIDYTAQGHTVGLAARMEQLAPPGSVYLTAYTGDLVTGYFTLHDLGPTKVKGVRQPLGVFELQGLGPLRTRLDVSRVRGFSRFVGRTEELAALEAALARAAEGRGSVIGVVAEPGVGKSRLCYEFARQARAGGIAVSEAHCVPHGKMIPFLPLLEMLRRDFGIAEHEEDQAVRAKIADQVHALDDTCDGAVPLLCDFLGVSDAAQPLPRIDPEAHQRRLFAVLRRLLEARSRRGVVVMVIDDLQWMDGGSAVFLEQLVDTVRDARCVLVVNFRPGYSAAWMQRVHYQSLPLVPLQHAATAELLVDLVGSDPSVEALVESIRSRTAGNPFFIEEVVRSLCDQGVLIRDAGAVRLARAMVDVQIPATVQAVLAARIDRLPDIEKRMLETAAVIGKEVAEPVLCEVVEAQQPARIHAALRALVRAEFLYEVALYPEVVYGFTHPLMQEVAYRTQLGDRRARVHAAVARAMEHAYAGKLGERAALLAYHWEAAGEALAAANWHRRAAEWSGARDRGTLLRHWREVRRLLGSVAETPATLQLGLTARTQMLHNGIFYGQSDEEESAIFAEGMEIATRVGVPGFDIWLLADYGTARLVAGAVDQAVTHLLESLRRADALGIPLVRFSARIPVVRALADAGRLLEAVTIGEEAEVLCGGDASLMRELTGFSPYGTMLGFYAAALVFLGRLVDAGRVIDRALEIGRTLEDAETLTLAHASGALRAEMLGDAPAALTHARRAAEVANAGGSALLRLTAAGELGLAHLLAREWQDGINALTDALAIMRAHRRGLQEEGRILSLLAYAYLGAHDLKRAAETATLAVETARQHGTRVHAIGAHLTQARVRLVLDGAAGAAAVDESLRNASVLVEETSARAYAPFVQTGYAELAQLTGDHVARQRALCEAQRLFVEMEATEQARRVASLMQ